MCEKSLNLILKPGKSKMCDGNFLIVALTVYCQFQLILVMLLKFIIILFRIQMHSAANIFQVDYHCKNVFFLKHEKTIDQNK